MNLRSPFWPGAVLSTALVISLLNSWTAIVSVILPPLISFPNVPFPIESPTVRVGQAVHTVTRSCVNTILLTGTISTIVTRDLVPLSPDLPTLRLPPIASTAPSSIPRNPDGCVDTRGGEALIIPRITPPGRYYWVGTISWQSPLRTGTAHWRTQTFEVVE